MNPIAFDSRFISAIVFVPSWNAANIWLDICLESASACAVSGFAPTFSLLFLPLPATKTSIPMLFANSNNSVVAAGSSPSDPVYTKSAASYIFFINGPIVISTSTFSNTMCFFANKVSNEIWAPTSGTPVASTITSTLSE